LSIIDTTLPLTNPVLKFLIILIIILFAPILLNRIRIPQILGFSNAQAAATLAAVIIGYNVIIGETVTGEPVRLLGDSILNGTIIMILVTCTIASFAAQKGAQNISLEASITSDTCETEFAEKILIPASDPETIEELIGLSTILKSKSNNNGLYALNIISNNSTDSDADKKARKILEKAVITASSTDNHLNTLLRYDLNITNGITSVIKEHEITDLVLGLHKKRDISESFVDNLTEGILTKSNTTTFIYKPVQPISTIKRHIIIVPEHAENEIGFPFWITKIWNIALNTGAPLLFFGAEQTIQIIKHINAKYPIEADYKLFDDWNDFLILSREIKQNDSLIIVMSRANKPSYHYIMMNIPGFLNKYFQTYSCILVYPMQIGVTNYKTMDLNNPSLLEPIVKLDEIGKTIGKLLKRK